MAMAFLLLFICLLIQTIAGHDLPKVTLPWGTWQASKYNDDTEYYTFSNIRFSRPATGNYRFNAPDYPANVSHPENALQDNSYGPSCIQIDPLKRCPAVAVGPTSEDCLFLDVYVPRSAWESRAAAADTPVVVWFFGGAFLYGSKNYFGADAPFYTGQGVLEAARRFDRNAIFVAGNYRLGAFGWLAGPSVEAAGKANAGLYDQRLLLQWVQDFIGLVKGDKTQVSMWGQSAGAGSIVHHLVQAKGTRDPLFKTALLQSPAFQWQWDRSVGGTLDNIYKSFAGSANCTADDSMACLRNASTAVLSQAAQQQFDQSKSVGLFPFGPAIDDVWLSDLPSEAFAKGYYWKGVTALVVSHVENEAAGFIPPNITNQEDVKRYIQYFMPENALIPVRDAIYDQYPPSKYSSPKEQVRALIQDSTFVCNTRSVFDAYHATAPTYMMDFRPFLGLTVHSTDLLPTFRHRGAHMGRFIEQKLCKNATTAVILVGWMDLHARRYQKYLASFAVAGDPNTAPDGRPVWRPATPAPPSGDAVTQVLGVNPWKFKNAFTDPLNTYSVCNFWHEVARKVNNESKKSRGRLAVTVDRSTAVTVGAAEPDNAAWHDDKQYSLEQVL